MDLLPPILADTDDVVKVVIGIIVFVVWGIGALANMAKKQNRPSPQSQMDMEQAMRAQMEEARRREAAQALGEMGGPPPMRPLPPPPILQPQQQQERPSHPRPRGPVVPPMRNLPQAPPPPRPRPAVRAPVPVVPPPPRRPGPIMQPQRQQPKKQQRRRTPQKPLPLPELVPVSQPLASELVSTPGVRESEIGTGVTAASPSRRAATAAPTLRLTAQGLRQQFILTEILQPPLALRERPPGA